MSADNTYYRRGNLVGIIPTPTDTTDEAYSGTVTVIGSVCTDLTADWDTNELVQSLAEVDGSLYIIVSNTSTTFTVDGSPTAGTYVIYEKGLESWYTKKPSDLSSDTDNIAGEEEDHWKIVDGVLSKLFQMLGEPEKAEYHRLLYERGREDRRLEFMASYASPAFFNPRNFRSDLT